MKKIIISNFKIEFQIKFLYIKNMSLNLPNNLSPINIYILDIFPSYQELNPLDEEILLIFEGINYFYDLKALLTSNKKIEIENNKQPSIIISLIKSNSILASGNLNLKHGEQWITLNSENKKKSNMNLALSLIDCIKLKIFCEMKITNKIGLSANISNLNNSLNLTNINNGINFTKRNINKQKPKINQNNYKISKKNTNNRLMLKGSPRKINLDIYGTRRSPKNNNIYDLSGVKYETNEINTNSMLKKYNTNLNSINHQSSNQSKKNQYLTINKKQIKKIDLHSSSRTRNPKLNRNSPMSSKQASLQISKNHEIIKMKTSIFNKGLNNKKEKLKITPDIEIKELHNANIIGGSPKLYHKNKLIDDIYQNSGNAGNKTFHYGKINNNIHLNKNYINYNTNNNNKTKKKTKNNYSNNILNINYENNNNNIINMNIVNNINNQCRTINDNNTSNYNNTYGNKFNNQDINNKFEYSLNNNMNYIRDSNLNKNKNNELENSLNSNDSEEEKNIINKTNEKIVISEKMGIYTNKRKNIKKNRTLINKKNQENNINSEKKIKEENIEINQYKNNNKNEETEIKDDLENNEDNEDDDNNFGKLKEDFLLLYNDNYVNNIQEDLLKLEIELFIEKMIELIQCYHTDYYQKNMEKEIILNNHKKYCFNYKKFQKLIKQLELCKIDYKIKNTKEKNYPNCDNISINKGEIEIFKYIFEGKNKHDNKTKLKNIFNIIINNKNNLNYLDLIDKDKFHISLNNNIIDNISVLNPNNYYRKKQISSFNIKNNDKGEKNSIY